MTLWVCTTCTTKYAVGLHRCPRCHGTDFVEDGQPMPKITRSTGPSLEAAEPGEPGYQPDITVERPAGNASTEAWRAYLAQLEGPASPGRAEELDRMSRADLIAEADKREPASGDGGETTAEAEPVDPAPAEGATDATEEEPSPGSSSQTSGERQEPSQPTSGNEGRKPARTTGNRSSK